MLDVELGLSLDPSLLMERAGLMPDDWQRDLLRSDARRTLILAARQCGKSTVAAYIALAEALFRPKSLTLCVSPSQRQSGELFRKVAEGFQHVSDLAGVVAESALRIEFANGSRVISLPGAEGTIRGYSGVTLLLLDEAARIEDSMLAATRPMLATTNGRILALSTGWLRSGWFYESWMATGGGEDWQRIEITADRCPRISAQFLAQERAALGAAVFAAEYGCSFVDESGSFFDPDAIARAFRDDLPPLFPSDPDQAAAPLRRAELSGQLAAAGTPRSVKKPADLLSLTRNVSCRDEDNCECKQCQAEDTAHRDRFRWY